jgi:hypothetical protein
LKLIVWFGDQVEARRSFLQSENQLALVIQVFFDFQDVKQLEPDLFSDLKIYLVVELRFSVDQFLISNDS